MFRIKRYEEFNKMLNTDESAEIQSFGMILAQIQEQLSEEHEIDIDLSWWKKKHKAQFENYAN